MEKRLEEMVPKFISVFENQTGITGLNFIFHKENIRGKIQYSLLSPVSEDRIGIMANNFTNVFIKIDINVFEEEKKITLSASWKYEHKSLGSNGIEVMDKNGNNRFWYQMEL